MLQRLFRILNINGKHEWETSCLGCTQSLARSRSECLANKGKDSSLVQNIDGTTMGSLLIFDINGVILFKEVQDYLKALKVLTEFLMYVLSKDVE